MEEESRRGQNTGGGGRGRGHGRRAPPTAAGQRRVGAMNFTEAEPQPTGHGEPLPAQAIQEAGNALGRARL